MDKKYFKLPDAAALRRHVEDGMDAGDIAIRYGSCREAARTALKKAGLLEQVQKNTIVAAGTRVRRPTLARDGIRIMTDKVIHTKELSAGEYGGSAIRRISVPFNSMYVAALQDAKRC